MSDLTRLRRISRFMQHFATAAVVLLPLVLALIWLNIDFLLANHPAIQNLAVDKERLSPPTRLAGFAVSMVPAGILMWGLWKLRDLFAGYARAEIFTQASVDRLRSFSWALLLSVVAQIVTTPVLSVLVTINNPPGQKALSITFGSNEVMALFIVGLLFAITWVMAEGRRLADENAEIV